MAFRHKRIVSEDQLDLFSLLARPNGTAPVIVPLPTPTVNPANLQPVPTQMTFSSAPAKSTSKNVIPLRPRHNFRLPDNVGYPTGAKARYVANMTAIKTLQLLETTGNEATDDEKEILSQYTGWGGLDAAFDSKNASWVKEYTELKNTLSEDEYKAARSSILSAYYTPAIVIKAIWDTLLRFGFNGGNILEPACGTGRFFGHIPENIGLSWLCGCELDDLTGRIAKKLYPNTDIQITGFEKALFEDNFFDVIVGNIPFGDFPISDTRYAKYKLNIHHYFIMRCLDLVRPNGIVAFISTKGTLDKKNSNTRKQLAMKANLIGAVRLPENAFSGAGVTSDILFFQKKEHISVDDQNWLELSDINGVPVNGYYAKHPEMLLGEMKWDSRYDGHSVTTLTPAQNWQSKMDVALRSLEAKLPQTAGVSCSGSSDWILARPGVKNYSFTLVDDKVYYREDTRMRLCDYSPKAIKTIKAYIWLRDCVHEVLNAQLNNKTESEIENIQKELNTLYDDFVQKHNTLTGRSNALRFKDDADYPLMSSLEIQLDDGSVCKAEIFSKRTIKRRSPVNNVDLASEALPISLDVKGCLDLDYICNLTGKDRKTVLTELKGLAFQNPDGFDGNNFEEKWETADEYLSGNIRKKLCIAEAAAIAYPDRYTENVTALKRVLPPDLDATDIDLRLGAVWIDPQYITDFICHLLKPSESAKKYISAEFTRHNATWHIEGKGWENRSVLATETYGTHRVNAYDIIEDTLNLKATKVFDYEINDKGNRVARTNRNETIAAQEKQTIIQQEFKEWIFCDSGRRAALTRKYNDLFNSVRLREFDGSYLTFPGMAEGIVLKKHQKNAAARIIFSKNTLLAHAVGAGKTFEMIAAAMELKRLGLVNKPMFVVPNHLVKQWGTAFLCLYPSANILLATKDDFVKDKRRRFCAKIATGNYDAVIISHSAFGKIPVSDALIKKNLDRQVSELNEAIRNAEGEKGSRYTIRQLEVEKKRLEAQYESSLTKMGKDLAVNFEELGVDQLFVDEAHSFKNLFLYTKMRNVAGVQQSHAGKSSDLYMKIGYLHDINNGKGVVFATGTPISNSMTEMYTMQRYLQPDELAQMGLEHFDCWASTFGETVTSIELAPEGTGYRAKTRFSRFYNIPELMRMFKNIADIQTADMLKLPTPALEGGKIHNILSKASQYQKDMIQQLARRAKRVRDGAVDSSEDNMLVITTDGRALALDQRLMNPSLPDDPNSKVDNCVDNVFDIWKRTAKDRLTQLVFCDQSTPKYDGTFNVYVDMKKKLIAKGIPECEIAFIHDADKELQKEALFTKIRSGVVRICFGSTSKMGEGTNVQNRLYALHHVDVPWKPSEIEQREGRILRRHNNNPAVLIFRYITEGTFDAYSWQLIENKQKFISQIMSSNALVRSAEDIDATALSYAEVKALATGNPMIKEKMDLDIQVDKLQVLETQYRKQHYRLEDKLNNTIPNLIHESKMKISCLQEDLQCRDSNTGEDFVMSLGTRKFCKKRRCWRETETIYPAPFFRNRQADRFISRL